jgi:hypothetical protein
MSVMSFREWLIAKKLKSLTPAGDFARDVNSDETAASVPNTREAWLSYLNFAPENVLEVFATAWAAYVRAS